MMWPFSRKRRPGWRDAKGLSFSPGRETTPAEWARFDEAMRNYAAWLARETVELRRFAKKAERPSPPPPKDTRDGYYPPRK